MSGRRIAAAAAFSSITARLAALYFASTFLILLFVSIGLYRVLSRSLELDEQAALAREVAELAALLRNPQANRPLIAMEIDPARGEHTLAGIPATSIRIVAASGDALFETSSMQARLPRGAFPQPAGGPVEQRSVRRVAADGVPYLLVSAFGPVTAGGGPLVIQAAIDVSSDAELLRDYRRYMALLLVLGTLLSSGLGVLVARHGIRPVNDIAAVVRRVGFERLDERVKPSRWPRELRELAGAFDHMLERLEASVRQLEWFSADVAHELRTPVNVLMGEAEVALSRNRTGAEYRRVLESALEEYQRLARLIDSLLFLARAESARTQIERVSFESGPELAAVNSFFEATAQEHGITVSVDGVARVSADPTLFRRAVSNLLSNALQHTPRGGRVVLTAKPVAGGGAEIVIADTGSGIERQDMGRVFDRFYRGNGQRRQAVGTGIGLAIVRSIMSLHGGTVDLDSAPGKGTTACLRFPAEGTPPAD